MAGAHAWLSSAAGERWVRGEILARVNAGLAGRLELGAVHVRGLSIDLDGLVLRAPSGAVVARADRLGPVPLLPLWRGRAVLDGSRLDGLSVELDAAPGDVPPIAAALRGAPGGTASGGAGLVVRDVRIEGARVVVRQALVAPAARTVVVEGLRGRLRHGGGWEVGAEGTFSAPLAGPVRARVEARGGPAPELAVVLEGSGIDAAVRGRRTPGGVRIAIDRLALDPDAARALWPGSPLTAPLALRGSAFREGSAWTVEVSGRLGAAPLEALTARALARAGGWDLAASARLRGVRVEGRGALRGGRVAAQAEVVASDLAALGAVLGAFGAPGPVARGAGRARLSLHGRAADPAIRLEARLEDLAAGPVRARRVRVLARVARASAPLAAARLAASAAELSVAGHEAGPARGDLAARRGRLRATASLRGRTELAGAARVAAGGGGARIDALALRIAGTTWRLHGGARLARRGAALEVRGLELRAGAQRLALEGWVGGGRVRARAGLRDVELAALARALIGAPPLARAAAGAPLARAVTGALPLAGQVSGVLDASGPLGAPRLEAALRVRRAPFPGSGASELRVAAVHAPGRTRVTVRGVLGGGAVALDGELLGGGGGGGAPRLRAELRLVGAAAGPLLAAVPGVRRATGRVDARLRAEGDARAPEVHGTIAWRRGTLSTAGFGTWAVALAARAEGRRLVVDRLALRGGRGALVATGHGERAGGSLLFRGAARLSSFPIVSAGRLRARADGALAFSGQAAGGRLRAALTISDAAVRLPPRIGQVQGRSRPRDVRIVHADRPVATWGAPAPAPRRPGAWPEPEDPPLAIALATRGAVPVRGDAVDVRASLAPGFRAARAGGRWGVFGTVRVHGGAIGLLGSSVPVLPGSELHLRGPVARAAFALAVRGGLAPPSVLVIHGEAGALELALPPPGAGEREVLAALAERRDTAGAAAPPLPLVSVRLPLAQLLGAPPSSSYDAATPLGRLRLGFASQVGADPRHGENARSARLQLRLAPSLEAQLSAGDAGATSADLLWNVRAAGRRAAPDRVAGVHIRGMATTRRAGKGAGRLPREEGAREAEAEAGARRTAPPPAARQHRGGDDAAGYPATTDEPAVRGTQAHAARRVAQRGTARGGQGGEGR